jgi:DeoR/GlpR family transcriptional regulator of sugar metabolism
MLREERLQYILQKLETEKRISSVHLSQELRISDDTIRRDLNELAEQGLIKKVHGGAMQIAPKSSVPLHYETRLQHAQEEKKTLAKKAISLFKNGQVIILDGGSTTNFQVAQQLPKDLQATIFTNSLPIATALTNYENIEVVMLGGKIFKKMYSTVDLKVIEALDEIRADICLLGVCSIHHEIGVTNIFREEAFIKRKMAEVAAKTVVLATADKIDTAETYLVCKYTDLQVLVTDDKVSQEILDKYEDKGVWVM